MIQIWFGLIWANPKQKNINKKQQNTKKPKIPAFSVRLFCGMGSDNKESA